MTAKLTIGFLLTLSAAGARAEGAGRVVMIDGSASVTTAQSAGKRQPLAAGQWLNEGDAVYTGKGAYVRILMQDRSLIDLGPSTWITLKSYQVSKRGRSGGMKLWLGRMWAKVSKVVNGDAKAFEVETANAVAGVRGTEFGVEVNQAGETQVTVLEGAVEVTSRFDGGGGATELLGPLSQASFGQNAPGGTREISQDQARGAAQQTRPSFRRPQSSTSPSGLTQPGATGPGSGGSPAGRLEDLGERVSDPSQPVVDFDPGITSQTLTTVIGTVEIRN